MAPTTRRQQNYHNAVIEHAGLKSSRRPAESTAAPTTRQLRKRKAPTQGPEESPGRKRINHDGCTDGNCVAFREQISIPSIETTPSTPSSGFLSLPRELRDEIYKHVLHSVEERAVTLQDGNLITKSSLIRVNTQIKQEFLDAVLLHAPTIHTTVRNHNFAHVVTFLNQLSDAQMRKLAAASTPSSDSEAKMRSRKIVVTLTYSRTKASTKPQLNRWLDRFDDPRRRGAEVRFEYRLDRGSWRNGGYKQRATGRTSAGPRSREEVRKILDVTRAGSSGYWC
ncbi:uncharacterized protein M421DRAFT_423123 [Didymella exigua CBS 183.55]|uniref:F-box domain-containing protein n=1 Tax=Didymella exigua CBS 183.55 TaxID=1150837 RepID=A0A6A5REL8_9PLEO|nr:uncharacterized protein M421DRAFT_423123 [Didymella exigua CBS 183.55]KAF1926132.1 hypothetical protein M421DRAFT_423123 [Didymella exigua CBS 183.55]